MSRFGTDGEFPFDILHPLPHAGQADTGRMTGAFWFKTGAVVLDGRQQPVGRSLEEHIDMPGMGMLGDVAQAFLDDSIDTQGSVRRHIFRQSLIMAVHRDILPVGKVDAERVDRPLQSEVLEDRRVQFPGESVDIVGKIDHLLLDVSNPVPQRCRFELRRMELEGAGLDGERRQALGVIVMEFTRQPAQLFFLGGDQAAGQRLQFTPAIPQGGLGLFALPQVEDQADDQHRLQGQQDDDSDDILFVQIPDRGLAKEDGAVLGQKSLGDIMPLELPPVVLGQVDVVGSGEGRIARGLTAQDAQGHFRRLLAFEPQGNKRPADDAVTHVGFIGAEDGQVGIGGNRPQHHPRHVTAALAVDEEGRIENDRVLGKMFTSFEDITE